MDVRWLIFATCALITEFVGFAEGDGFQECFRKDSISCLQMQLFKATRKVVDNSTIEIFDGIGLIKIGDNEGKSFEQKATEEKVTSSRDVQSRQRALESYLIAAAERLWNERTVTWNPTQIAKALVNSIPDRLTTQLTSFVLQGRAKKKQLRMLIPLLIALKLKMATIASIAMMVIAIIAKKAILAAAVSLVITGVTGLKSLIGVTSKQPLHPAEVMGYQAAAEWEPSSYGYGDSLSGHIEPAPHHQTFVGHKGG